MKNIARILPYFWLEKWSMADSRSTKAHIKSKDGFKHQLDEGLEVQLWEIFPGTFLCKSEYALLKNKHDNLKRALENVDEKLSAIDEREVKKCL